MTDLESAKALQTLLEIGATGNFDPKNSPFYVQNRNQLLQDDPTRTLLPECVRINPDYAGAVADVKRDRARYEERRQFLRDVFRPLLLSFEESTLRGAGPSGEISRIRLGDIALGEKLGAGGFGNVYAATSPHFPIPIAVKVLEPDRQKKESKAFERFEQEIKLLFSLRHPYIIQVLLAGALPDGRPFFAMERFPGQDFTALRETWSNPDPLLVLKIIRNAARGLHYAHTRTPPVVHRDIKPSNIMWTNSGDVRVLDFGIAALVNPDRPRLTEDGGTMVGNLIFTAPRVLADHRFVHPKCDIYSLGGCWLWALTGVGPYNADPAAALKRVPSLPPGYDHLLLRCLADFDETYHSAQELVSEILALEKGEAPTPVGIHRDELVIVLGAIIDTSGTINAAVHEVAEARAAHLLKPFAFRTALHQLEELRWVERVPLKRGNVPLVGLRASANAMAWVSRNLDRIGTLLTPTPSSSLKDDIPF